MNWRRAIGYGVALWATPFVVSVILFPVREGNRPLFESLIVVLGIILAVSAALYYFRDIATPGLHHGLLLGLVWAAISVLIDLPVFLLVFHMGPLDYLADVALTYLAFPAIAAGIALARSLPPARG